MLHPHGCYGHGVPRVPTDKPTGQPISIQYNNQPTTGAAKAGSGGGGNGNSNGSGDNCNNGGSGCGKDNGGDSAAVAAVAAGATKTTAVTAMAGGVYLEEPISSGYPAPTGLTWRNQFLLVTQPQQDQPGGTRSGWPAHIG